MWGIEMVKDRETREPMVPFNATGPAMKPVSDVVAAAQKKGVMFWAHWNVLALTPPLIIGDAELDEGAIEIEQHRAAAAGKQGRHRRHSSAGRRKCIR